MNRKFHISLGILFFSLLSILFLWKQAMLLSAFLILLAYIKHTLYPIKRELLWFVLISIGGAAVEIILVNVSHAWSYATPHFFGIPIYMPLFWGLVGTTIIVLYEGLTKK